MTLQATETDPTWVHVAAVTDIPEGGCLGVEVGSQYVALYNIGGRYFATDNICSHQMALLSEGSVDGEYVECPLHQGRFHIPTGAPQGVPVTEPIKVFPTKVEGEKLLILISQTGI